MDVTCPSCDTYFEADVWEAGHCPKCGKQYWWDEECTEDYSDCWALIQWSSQ